MKYKWTWPLWSRIRQRDTGTLAFDAFFGIMVWTILGSFAIGIPLDNHSLFYTTLSTIASIAWLTPAALYITALAMLGVLRMTTFMYRHRPRRVLVPTPDIRQIYANKD